MEPVTLVLAAISMLFVALLVVKEVLPGQHGDRICALCVSVGLAWIGLLLAHMSGRFPHPELVALLMGSTVLGLYYEFEHRVRDELKLFRLPTYLTLFLAAYSLLTATFSIYTVTVLSIIWLCFGALYVYRANTVVGEYVERIIACCKDW